jgi:hypothetical protein
MRTVGFGAIGDFSSRRVLGQDGAVSGLQLWGIRLGLLLLFATPLVVTTSTVFSFIVGKAVWSRSLIEIIGGLYVLLAIRASSYRPHASALTGHLLALLVAGYFGSSLNVAARKVINHRTLMAAPHQVPNDVGTYEARAAGHRVSGHRTLNCLMNGRLFGSDYYEARATPV